jgi:hypothetical protein
MGIGMAWPEARLFRRLRHLQSGLMREEGRRGSQQGWAAALSAYSYSPTFTSVYGLLPSSENTITPPPIWV